MADKKILCKTPTPNKKPVKIDRWKYDAIRTAILNIVPKEDEGKEGTPFKELAKCVEEQLTAEEKENLGSVNWYTTCVKLDMELKSELKRKKQDNIQILYKL